MTPSLDVEIHQPDDVFDIRRLNLEMVIAEEGNLQKLSEKLQRSHSQLSQIRNRLPYKRGEKILFRQMGDKFARHIEKCIGKPIGWMDQLHHDEIRIESFSEDVLRIAKGIEDIQDPQRRAFVIAACFAIVYGSLSSDIRKTIDP